MSMTEGRSIRQRIGIDIALHPARDAIALVRRAETAGVAGIWSVMSALRRDTPTLFAAAAVQTERIALGTAIVPALTRHPLTLAMQVFTLEELAPGRIRLGIGTSHAETMAGAYGLAFHKPLAHLREYLQVLRPALHDGAVSFQGDVYRVEATLPNTVQTPVLISALRESAFALAGELGDGAISWLCPVDYLLNHGKPAMQRAAEAAGRSTPPLVAHVIVGFERPGRDRAAIRAQAWEYIAGSAGSPFYGRMFAGAGYPVESDSTPNDRLIDQLLCSGDEAALAAQFGALLDRGLDELLVMVLPGPDREAEQQRLIELVGGLA